MQTYLGFVSVAFVCALLLDGIHQRLVLLKLIPLKICPVLHLLLAFLETLACLLTFLQFEFYFVIGHFQRPVLVCECFEFFDELSE